MHRFKFLFLIVSLTSSILTACTLLGPSPEPVPINLSPPRPGQTNQNTLECPPSEQVPSTEPESAMLVAGQLGGTGQAIAIQGDYAYTGQGTTLNILDLKANPQPNRIGYLVFPEIIQDIEVAGCYAYIALDGWAGLYIINIIDPAQPTVASIFQAEGVSRAHMVRVQGHYAYLAATYLHIIDITDPQNPIRVGQYQARVDVVDIHLESRQNQIYAYLAIGPTWLGQATGLAILDLSNPTTPREISFYETPGNPEGLALFDKKVYLADTKKGLYIIEVSDLNNPQALDFTAPTGTLHIVKVIDNLEIAQQNSDRGNQTYLLAGDEKAIHLFDVSQANAPNLIQSLELADKPVELAGQGQSLYAIGESGAVYPLSLKVSAPDSRPYLTQLPPYTTLSLSQVGTAAVTPPRAAHTYLYLGGQTEGLSLIDITVPDNAFEVNYLETQNKISHILLHENRVYLLEDRCSYFETCAGTLWILDAEDAPAMTVLGKHHLTLKGRGLAARDAYLYLVNDQGLSIFDLTNPEQLILVSRYDTPTDTVSDIAIVGKQAYLLLNNTLFTEKNHPGGLLILDIGESGESQTPELLGFYEAPVLGVLNNVVSRRTYSKLVVEDNKSYIAAADCPYQGVCQSGGGLLILDVSDPSQPYQIHFQPSQIAVRSLAIAANNNFKSAYLLQERCSDSMCRGIEGQLEILDLSQPDQPSEIARYPAPKWKNQLDLAVDENYIYLTLQEGGLIIFKRRVDKTN